jgi:flagellar protein FlbD
MIAVTRLSGSPLVVNAAMIRTVEARPDTYITMTDGERIIVRDPVEDVVAKVVAYQRRLRLVADAA